MIGKSPTFLQFIMKVLSNERVSMETNAQRSDTTLWGKDIAKRLNVEGILQHFTITSALSESDKYDSAIV